MKINNKNYVVRSCEDCALSLDQFDSDIIVSEKFQKTKAKALYALQGSKVVGVLTKGDYIKSSGNELKSFLNPNFYSFSVNGSQSRVDGQFVSVPIVSKEMALVKVLEATEDHFLGVGGAKYRPFSRVLTVAEIGNNHNGSVEICEQMIKAAAAAGAGAIKLQARCLSEVYNRLDDAYLRSTDYSTAYTIRQLQKYNLDLDEIGYLLKVIRDQGCLAICTPFDLVSMDFLLSQNLDAIKIASSDMTNLPLLEKLKNSSLPTIISTGMHSVEEIVQVSNFLKNRFIDATFMHANSTYPTPDEDVNLSFIFQLKDFSPSGFVGYSGHERGLEVPLAASAAGAVIIEKHFTFDKQAEGNDHKVSLLPDEFSQMVNNIERLQVFWGKGMADKKVSQGEKLNKIALAKGAYAIRDITAGECISTDDYTIKSPLIGLTGSEINKFTGMRLVSNIKAGEPLEAWQFSERSTVSRYEIKGKAGLPVRLRDIDQIWDRFSLDYVEYHMFSTDLEINPQEYRSKFEGKTLAVHAPEQFDDGFILDLVSSDVGYRERSIKKLDEIFLWASKIREITKQETVMLITNVGGAVRNPDDASPQTRSSVFNSIHETIERATVYGITMIPQSMPPFPWHFGGQGFHTLFVDPGEMIAMNRDYGTSFCVDLSHTWLACDYLGLNFYEEIAELSKFCSYYHIADAIAPGEEGLQIGKGEIDFKKIFNESVSDDALWLPEIWNGHMNNFQGFETAFASLETLLLGER